MTATSPTPFTVFNASAGAGKTYNLVLSYLRICLADTNANLFRSILAITFTNKAATEMKQRLIKALTEFSAYDGKEDYDMMIQLSKELDIELPELAKRSTNILRSILHAYSAFSVSTIDKFTNRLIRSFANDLNLNGNYEVELDGMEMLSEAVDMLLENLQEDSNLSEALVAFMRNQLADGKSPRIENNLVEMGKGLFMEHAQPFIALLEQTSLSEILEVRKKLLLRNNKIDTHLANLASGILDLIDYQKIEHTWFSRSGVPKWLQKIKENDLINALPTATLIKQINGEASFFSKENEKKYGDQLDVIRQDVQQGLMHIYQEMLSEFATYHMSALLLQDLYALAVLREIDGALQILKEETNRLPIGEFNKLIGERLQQQAAPFLYEKLGDRYRHFFIDEFQDTSILQWNNLTPLINNAMSEGEEASSAMLVGDGKQAIYRWRGGEVEQFLALSSGEHLSNKVKVGSEMVELYKRQTKKLEYNFRSHQNIVTFNNSFFTEISKTLETAQHQNLFLQSAQKAMGKEGGYVCLEINEYNKETFLEEELERINTTIGMCKNQGFGLGDIAILTRGAKEGKWIAEYLFEKGIPVVTAATLRFEESPHVNFAINFFKTLLNPKDNLARVKVMEFLLLKNPAFINTSIHSFLKAIKEQSLAEFSKHLSVFWEDFVIETFTQLSLEEKAYSVFNYLQLDIAKDPFTSAFLDEVHNFQNKHNGDVAGFIDWWEKTGHKKQLNVESTENAVRLMTIHKSKGLEFPVVLMPFADWKKKIGAAQEWVDLDNKNFYDLPAGRVSLKKDNFDYTNERYQYLYLKDSANVLLDNINIMYVAMTRAEEALFIFSSSGRYDQSSRISTYFKVFLDSKNAENIYENGKLKKREAKEKQNKVVPSQTFKINFEKESWREKLSVSVNAPKHWKSNAQDTKAFGKEVHEVLSKVLYSTDFVFDSNVSDEIKSMVSAVLNHSKIKQFYKPPLQVLNERDILLPNGNLARPDRVMLDGSTAHIIDYKTGIFYPKHEEQLRGYSVQLVEAGYQLGQLKLVYLGETITIKTI